MKFALVPLTRIALSTVLCAFASGCGAAADHTPQTKISATPASEQVVGSGPRRMRDLSDAIENSSGGRVLPPSRGNRNALVVGGTGSVDGLNKITYSGGPIMPGVSVKPIFYGAWAEADEDLIITFMQDASESPYWQINTTYFNPTDHTRASPYLNVLSKLELPTAPEGKNPTNASTVVQAQLDAGALQADDSVIYVVFTATNNSVADIGTDCGYHYMFAYNSTEIKYAMVNMPAKGVCGNVSPSPNGRPAADAALTVLAHELSETETDPLISSWGARGVEQEDGDLCNFVFGTTYRTANGAQANLQLHGHDYKVQQIFMNRSGGKCVMSVPPNGDVDADGKGDVIALGGSGWDTVPIYLSNGDGTFTASPGPLDITDFGIWASTANVQHVPGYYSGDGFAGVAVLGGIGWGSIPVAFGNGDNTFHVINRYIPDYGGAFGSWASISTAVPGDFDSDGCTDIALVGGSGWGSVPIAFSNCNGTFHVTNAPLAEFPGTASRSGVKKLSGDFDGDGRGDIALLQRGFNGPNLPPGVAAVVPLIEMAFSNGDGTFNVTDFSADWSLLYDPSVRAVAGDVDGDGMSDITLVSPNSEFIGVGFSAGDGTFNYRTYKETTFAAFATAPGAMLISADINGDGFSDLVASGKKGSSDIVSLTSDGAFGYSSSFSVYTDFGPSDLSWQARNPTSSILGNF